MDTLPSSGRKAVNTQRLTGCLLWPVALALTIAYWEEIRSLAWYWQGAIILGFLILLGTLRSTANRGADAEQALTRARSLVADHEYETALTAVEEALIELPGSAEAHYVRAVCLQRVGRNDDAVHEYEEVLKLDPKHAYAASDLGTLHMDGGELLKAVKYYRLAEASGVVGDWFDRNKVKLWHHLGQEGGRLARQGDPVSASEYFRLALDFGAAGPRFEHNLKVLRGDLHSAGREASKAGNGGEALRTADALVKVSEDWALAYAWRGTLRLEVGDVEGAAADLRKCRELDPSYSRIDEIEEAAQEAMRELEKLPKSSPTPCGKPSPAPQDVLWPVGSLALDRYEVRQIVGSAMSSVCGGMGTVYCTFDTKGHRLTAIKALRLDKLKGSQSSHLRMLFEGEARTWLELGHHPSIVQLFGISRFKARHLVLLMEYVSGVPGIGPTLRHHLQGRPLLAVTEAIRIGMGICEAMAFAYEKANVVHRDLKPENVFITESGEVKVGDFGLGRPEGDPTSVGPCGTGPYMAPEQGRPEKPAPTMDVYATGVILYEMLAGELPIAPEGAAPKSLQGWADLHRTVRPVPLDKKRSGLPAGLSNLVMKCLDKVPGRRYASIRELRDALPPFAPVASPGVQTPVGQGQTPGSRAFMRGISLYSLGELEAAIEACAEAVRHEPFRSKWSGGWCNMGMVYGSMGLVPEAMECFQKALQIDAEDPHARFGLATCLYRQQRGDEALVQVDRLLAMNKSYLMGDADCLKGRILLAMEYIDEAETAFRKALSLWPEDHLAHIGLGLCAAAHEDWEGATEHLKRAASIYPEYAETHAHLAEAWARLGRVEEALNEGRFAVSLAPKDIWIRHNVAVVCAAVEHYQEALEHVTEVLRVDPENTTAKALFDQIQKHM